MNIMQRDFKLLETILYIPDSGFFLLDEHVERILKAMRDFNLADSDLFQKKITREEIVNDLHCKVPQDGSYYRVRLLIDVDTNMEIEYTLLPVPTFSYESLDMIDDTEPFCSIVLDKQPFSKASNDPFVTHKTTQRDMYDEARKRTGCDWHATLDQPFDVILWNSKGHVTESSIANIAVKFQKDDKTIWKTPRVESGLLPGVFRSFLLLNHDIIQDDITIQELKQAHEEGRPIVCFNSVRKLYRVKLLSDKDA